MEYAYNNLGQKTEVSTTGLGLTYEYFANGWLKAVKMGNDTIAEYEYDQVGNRTGINLGNGTHTVYDYDGDPRYRVSGIGHYNGQTLLGSISYPSRDGSGNPLEMVVGNTGATYTYDMNSRLWKVTYSGQPQITHEYDWVGNRLVPGSAQYNAADQLTSGFGHTYNYDGRGNLTSSVGQDGKTYTYTPANLLSSVTHDEVQGTPVSSMTWDGDSNRVSFTRSTGGTWQYVYDPTAGIPAVIEEVKDGVSVYYIREPNGALITRVSTNGIHYYHFDALGSTRLLTDGSGAVTDEYSYDAWGNVSHDTGSTAQPYQFVGRLGYYTHVQDSNLPLLQLGVRFYDPEVGRFTQVDPVRDGLNWYAYVKNEATRSIDPTGLTAMYVPGMYARCKNVGGHIRLFEKWCREEKRYDYWKLTRCLAKHSCTSMIAVAHCVGVLIATKDPGAASACLRGMLGPESAADVVAIKECFEDADNFRWETVYHQIFACQFPNNTDTDWLDKDRPSGRGWELCD